MAPGHEDFVQPAVWFIDPIFSAEERENKSTPCSLNNLLMRGIDGGGAEIHYNWWILVFQSLPFPYPKLTKRECENLKLNITVFI